MTEATPTLRSQPSMEADDEIREEEADVDRGGGSRFVLPEDGHQWKKYGHKFIKSIGRYRSYFKCQNTNCRVKKRAEWSDSESGDVRVVYDGVHTHASPITQEAARSSGAGTSTTATNQYNLLTQVLGAETTTHTTHHHHHRHDN